MKKIALPSILLILGAIVAYFLIPYERDQVAQQFIGYPDSHKQAHGLRIYLLGVLCLLPFICNVLYLLCDTLDRYTIRIFLNSFLICFGALFMIMMLEDLQDNLSDFKQSEEMAGLMMKHYITKMPALIVFILPYSLMLSLLWALGKMSRTQEIVSMIQTGRGVFRLVRPLVGVGVICTTVCLIFNYHWAPHAESQEKVILNEATGHKNYAAKNVAFQNKENTRHWLVNEFPNDFSKGESLKYVSVSTLDDKNCVTSMILSPSAQWSESERSWTFKTPIVFDLVSETASMMPPVKVHKDNIIMAWGETPHQIINPGLKAHFLGIPGLVSWCKNHVDHPLSDKRSYQTQLYYRYAQPFICLIMILLAAPLGIVFNRRGVGGGVAVAIFLCAGMIFCSTVFPTLGDSGHLPPFVAAWATNILFTFIALYLFYRRMTGQPIYQTLKKLLPTGD